jgi:hypothetical protein
MNGERQQPSLREREIFLEALEKATPQDRAAYLEEACGRDDTLRQRIEALLQATAFSNTRLPSSWMLPPGRGRVRLSKV